MTPKYESKVMNYLATTYSDFRMYLCVKYRRHYPTKKYEDTKTVEGFISPTGTVYVGGMRYS